MTKAEYMREWRKENRDKVIEQKRKWRAENLEKARASCNAAQQKYKRRYRPVGQCKACIKPKQEGQGHVYCEGCQSVRKALRVGRPSVRNQQIVKAFPKWLTQEELFQMARIYTDARMTGHHVDHIVPLQGSNVSGLHVPWNLQLLTPAENRSKGNRYLDAISP